MIDIQINCHDCKKRERIESKGFILLSKAKDDTVNRSIHHLSYAEAIGMMVKSIYALLKS